MCSSVRNRCVARTDDSQISKSRAWSAAVASVISGASIRIANYSSPWWRELPIDIQPRPQTRQQCYRDSLISVDLIFVSVSQLGRGDLKHHPLYGISEPARVFDDRVMRLSAGEHNFRIVDF